jgi:multidrug efflux pump subunit AcrB
MTKEKYPDVALDEVWVFTSYPGVSPEEIERLITIPIEDEVVSIDGIDRVRSVSSEGYSQIEIDFEAGIEDFPRKVQEVQNKVNRVDDLPEDAETPEVEEEQWATTAVVVSLSGDVPEDTLKRLSEDFEDDLLDIPGIDTVTASGRRDREIWVEVDPGRLEGYELALADVILSLRNKNLDIPGGTLGSGREELLVRTMGEAETLEQIERVIIRSTAEAGHVYTRDVAKVSDTFEEATTEGRLDGHKAISLRITKSKTGDTIRVVRAVKELKKAYENGKLPDGVTLTLTNDASVDIWSNLNALYQNGAVGLVLVLTILCLFVGLRPAVLTAGDPVDAVLRHHHQHAVSFRPDPGARHRRGRCHHHLRELLPLHRRRPQPRKGGRPRDQRSHLAAHRGGQHDRGGVHAAPTHGRNAGKVHGGHTQDRGLRSAGLPRGGALHTAVARR